MSVTRFRGAVEWALMVALVAGSGVIAQANDEKAPAEGRVVRIGPEDENSIPALPAPAENEEGQVAPQGLPGGGHQVEMPKYWIGLLGGPITPELRAFLDIPEDQGVMIREVVPDSPAAKAGLKKYDIVLRANDTLLNDMRDMVEIVRTEGDKQGQITLEVLRKGGRESVTLTPEERPEHVAQSGSLGGGRGGAIAGQQLPPGVQQFFQNFGGEGEGFAGGGGGGVVDGMPFEFRNFGPGVVVQPGPGRAANIPSGVSVSISKQEGQPAHVTVKRGEESWEVVGDDQKSLEKLPADLQPYVAGLLHGQGDVLMPRFGGHMGGIGRFDEEGLQKRLEAMEKQMQELQKNLVAPENTPADKTK